MRLPVIAVLLFIALVWLDPAPSVLHIARRQYTASMGQPAAAVVIGTETKRLVTGLSRPAQYNKIHREVSFVRFAYKTDAGTFEASQPVGALSARFQPKTDLAIHYLASDPSWATIDDDEGYTAFQAKLVLAMALAAFAMAWLLRRAMLKDAA